MESLLNDPDWDNNRSIDPRMGVLILQDAALAEHDCGGRITPNDSKLVAPLRKALSAIQTTVLEVQEDLAVPALGVFSVADELKEFHVKGGDVCLTHLMEEIKNPRFLLNNVDHYLDDLYENWTTVARAVKLDQVAFQTQTEELIKAHLKAMSVWIEEKQQWFRHNGETFVPDDEMTEDGDWEPCADCARCRRRNFLGHRHPDFANIKVRT